MGFIVLTLINIAVMIPLYFAGYNMGKKYIKDKFLLYAEEIDKEDDGNYGFWISFDNFDNL